MLGSRRTPIGWAVVGVMLGAVAGCCGGAPSHACTFTPDSVDASPDGPLPCGQRVCTAAQVCCVTKVPPAANCIDPQDFQREGCELPPPPSLCTAPADCTGGLVCCVQKTAMTVACAPRQSCPGDGVDTLLACSSDQDCPTPQPGSCMAVDAGADFSFSICAPAAP